MSAWSQTFTFLDGQWLEGNAPIIGARTHAFWLGSSVFDGARAFEGVTPDLDKHCARLNRSAKAMCLKPTMSVEAMIEIATEGMKKFRPGAELYIRPMYWAERGSLMSSVPPDPNSTRFCLCLYEAPLPQPTGVSITRSPFAKPLGVTIPIEAKAGCLYPNNGRALIEARARGFDNCLMCDMLGNVAELRDREHIPGQGRRGDDADGQWDVPQRRHAAAGAGPAARRRRRRARGDARLR